MNDGIQGEVYLVLATHRVNVDLMFGDQWEPTEVVTVRLRPWKNSDQSGKMILAGAYTVDEALLWAVRGLLNNKWIPLNWQQRASTNGVVLPGQSPLASREARPATTNLSPTLFDLDGYQDTEALHIVGPGGAQAVLEPIDKPLRPNGRK